MSDSPQRATLDIYEQYPYESIPHYESHPNRLAAIAFLSGLAPSRLEGCRVLELGCATGGNLLAMAESLPGATFVGVDLAANQIAAGRAAVEQLGLKNVQLHAMSLLDFAPDFGQFDFIIAQGLYTWVPAPVQDRIFEICRDHLAPNGVAFVSYDTLPGWRIRGITRELVLYGIEDLPADASVQTRLKAGMDFAVAMSQAGVPSHYARALRADVETMLRSPPWYVTHEYLEPDHLPCYFRDFIAKATAHGLSYVGDARPPMACHTVVEALKASRPDLANGDPIRFEQCVDFAFGRQFRRSLLCRADQTLLPRMDAARLTRCRLTANVFPQETPVDLRPNVNVLFQSAEGMPLNCDDPLTKAALATLAGSFPLSVAFDELWQRTAAALGLPPHDPSHPARSRLAEGMLQLVSGDAVEPTLMPPVFAKQLSARPVASPLARWQASTGRIVHTRRHRVASGLDPLDRAILPLLDGTRDGSALRQALIGAGRDAATVDHALSQSLHKLVMNALLIA